MEPISTVSLATSQPLKDALPLIAALADLFALDTEEQLKRFKEDPKHALKYRKMMESELNQRFKFIVQGTPEQKASLVVS
jgi:hypothetical protein